MYLQLSSGNMAVTGWVLAMRNLRLKEEQTPKRTTCLELRRASQRR